MGHQISKETNIIVTGLYDAGKTTFMQMLNGGDTVDWLLPSRIGRSTLKKKNLIFTSWDMGGRDKIRPLYRHFLRFADAVIYVVDSQALELFADGMVRDQLQNILAEEELQTAPLLLLANKQDLPGALTCSHIRDRLDLNKLERERPVEILPISLVTGEGFPEVLDWLDRQRNRKALQKMVVHPLEKAVPPPVTSAGSKLSFALKQAFGLVKEKLPLGS